MRLVVLVLLLAACTRPLTPVERSFVATVQGDRIDLDRVRIVKGALIGGITSTRPARPRVTCRERIGRPETTPTVSTSTAAFVLFNTVFYATPYWREDFLAGYPETLPLGRAMLLTHELTHVWQWQNRAVTGYTPFKAATEHRPGGDPYLFDIADDRAFLEFDYEQQGALVEEFVCCRALAPDGVRTERLRQLLLPHFPAIARAERVPRDQIELPYPEADLSGLCDEPAAERAAAQ